MTKLGLVLLLVGWWLGGLNKISHSNELKKQAQTAYSRQQYDRAAAAWAELLQLQTNPDPAIRLNLGHALRLQNKQVQAAREYQQVVKAGSSELRSVAHLQLGNMLAAAGQHDQALEAYKAALKANAANNQARYNYELLTKYLNRETPEEEQPEQAPEQQNPEQQQQNQPRKGGGSGNQNQPRQAEGGSNQTGLPQGSRSGNQAGRNTAETDSSETPDADLPPQTGQKGHMPGQETSVHRLEQIRMTEDRARALLEAMRRAELQYLQQVPRKHQMRPKAGKPQW